MASMVLTTVFPAYTTVAPATSATANAVAQPCKHTTTINANFILTPLQYEPSLICFRPKPKLAVVLIPTFIRYPYVALGPDTASAGTKCCLAPCSHVTPWHTVHGRSHSIILFTIHCAMSQQHHDHLLDNSFQIFCLSRWYTSCRAMIQ